LRLPLFDVYVEKPKGRHEVKFLLYTTGDNSQPSAPPTQDMIEEFGKFTEETRRAGVLLATGGLSPSTTRVRNVAGKLTVTDGPFTETKELTGGFALVEVKSREEAIEWAKRFRKIVGEGDSLVQEVFD
jgi:hypothetical protein